MGWEVETVKASFVGKITAQQPPVNTAFLENKSSEQRKHIKHDKLAEELQT